MEPSLVKDKLFLDPKISAKLRDEVNDDVKFSIETKQTLSKAKKDTKLYPAWNRICAIMDRIDDIVFHINNMTVSPSVDNRSAFSYFDLLNHAAVLIDCINEIARIYGVNLSTVDTESCVFNNRGHDGNGSDKEYFEYLRSLCSVHPFNTSRHPHYQHTEFECCPYVIWADDYKRELTRHDLIARVYTNETGEDHYKTIYISLSEVFAYIQRRYNLLDSTIINGIRLYKEAVKDSFRRQAMKTEQDFPNYTDYLKYLKTEGKERFGGDLDFYLDQVMAFMGLSFAEQKNHRALTKYQNALKYAISFHHKCLQNMSFDGFEHNGIQHPEPHLETTLLHQLIFLNSHSKTATQYNYSLSKRWELEDSDAFSYHYAMAQLKHATPFLEKYVSLREAKRPYDYFVLSQIALYLDCLKDHNLLNRNIPNELLYRMRRLTDNQLQCLYTPPQKHETSSLKQEQLKELLETYGATYGM